MSQQSLAFQSHSPTSQAAAEAYAPLAIDARRRVYNAIRHSDDYGLTDEQIQDALRMNPSTQRPRRRELEAAGLVVDSGRTRKCRSGMAAVIWISTDAEYPIGRWPSRKKKQ